MAVLSAGDAAVVGALIRIVLDIFAYKTGKTITLDEFQAIIAQKRVRKEVLALQRKNAVNKIDAK